MHDLTTVRTADLPLGIQNFSLKCARMWFCPACNNLWWNLAISSWATWCFGGTIIGNMALNAIGASAMRPPTLMTQPSNMVQSFTILLKRLTWPLVSKSCISSAYTSLCTSLTIVNVAFSRSAVVRCFSISAFFSLPYWRYALNFSSQATFRWSTVQEEYFTSNSCNFSCRVRVNIALSPFSPWSSLARASIS